MDELAPLAQGLRQEGWGTAEGLFEPALLVALAAEARAHAAAGRLHAASTGRADGRVRAGLRGDSTLWLDDPACGTAAAALLARLEGLRREFNRALLPGLDEVEAHFAHYPPGAAYGRHRDRFRDDDSRLLSLVLYLNDDWTDDAGGALRLHLPSGTHDVAPVAGTSAWFLSDEIEHEVLPALRDRYSVAAWFRRRAP